MDEKKKRFLVADSDLKQRMRSSPQISPGPVITIPIGAFQLQPTVLRPHSGTIFRSSNVNANLSFCLVGHKKGPSRTVCTNINKPWLMSGC